MLLRTRMHQHRSASGFDGLGLAESTNRQACEMTVAQTEQPGTVWRAVEFFSCAVNRPRRVDEVVTSQSS